MHKEKIINGQTGEITWRDFSNDEIKINEELQKQTVEKMSILETRLIKRQSALAKLAALGLTEDEIAAL